jgi:hypothetical protein
MTTGHFENEAHIFAPWKLLIPKCCRELYVRELERDRAKIFFRHLRRSGIIPSPAQPSTELQRRRAEQVTLNL